MTLRDQRGDKEETVTLPPDSGFEPSDSIVGTTDPDGDDPFRTAPLRIDPRDPQGRHLDYFQLLDRLDRLAARPVVIQVRRWQARGPSRSTSSCRPPITGPSPACSCRWAR